MQKNFIEELDNRGKIKIDSNNQKINELDDEVAYYMNENSVFLRKGIQNKLKIKKCYWCREKLGKLNNLRGKSLKK